VFKLSPKELKDQARLLEERERRREADLLLAQKAAAEDSLYEFVKLFWSVVEPANPLVEGRVLEVMCSYFETVTEFYETEGESGTQDLLVNVPPGFSKSLIASVFFPAFEWGPRNHPNLRYACFSYSSDLTSRDNLRFKTVITSPLYQKLWGDRVKLTKDGEQKIVNTAMGWKLASSVGGVGTGERADRLICFPAGEMVTTANGLLPIGEIVEQRLDVKVLSTNVDTGITSWKAIKGWHQNPASAIVEVGLSDGATIRCTPNHRIWTSSRGWVEAKDLNSCDKLPRKPALYPINSIFFYIIQFCKCNLRLFAFKNFAYVFWRKFMISCRAAISIFPKIFCNNAPRSTRADSVDGSSGNVIGYSKLGAGIIALRNGNSFRVGKFGIFFLCSKKMSAMLYAIVNVLNSCAVFKVLDSIIGWITIKVPNIVSFRAFSFEGGSNTNMHPECFGFSLFSCIEMCISFAIRGGFHNFIRDCKKRIASFDRTFVCPYATKVADAVNSFIARDRKPLFVRYIGHVDKTFCLSVEDNHTFYAGARQPLLVKNCDDPHNIRDGESEVKRSGTLLWWREVIPTRLNNPDISSKLVIMQRVHEDDVSNDIIEKDTGFEIVRLPMEYDPLFPRCEAEWRTEPGELLWPERFDEAAVYKLKTLMGPHATTAQFQQNPIVRGGNIINQDWWKLYDMDYAQRLGLVQVGATKLAYPPFDLVVVSVDTALTTKKENCYSGCTVWGTWKDEKNLTKVMLIHAWQARLPLHGLSPESGMTEQQKKDAEGLVERIARTASPTPLGITPRGAQAILIENKANGADVINELARLYRNKQWQLIPIDPKGDKIARTHAVVPIFTQGLVYAPNKAWAQAVINQMASFPRGKDKDMHDSAVHALNWLRNAGIILRPDEEQEIAIERGKPRGYDDDSLPYDV